jgi:hypothetical protein
MIRQSLLIGALLTLAAHAHAQTASPRGSDPHDILGVWEGKYTSNHAPSGPLKITIAKDSVVKATMDFGTSLHVPHSSFKTITHEGNRIEWTQELMGTACTGTGTVDGGKFKGEITCGPGVINFEVRKK